MVFVLLDLGGQVVDMRRSGKDFILVIRFPVQDSNGMVHFRSRDGWETGIFVAFGCRSHRTWNRRKNWGLGSYISCKEENLLLNII